MGCWGGGVGGTNEFTGRDRAHWEPVSMTATCSFKAAVLTGCALILYTKRFSSRFTTESKAQKLILRRGVESHILYVNFFSPFLVHPPLASTSRVWFITQKLRRYTVWGWGGGGSLRGWSCHMKGLSAPSISWVFLTSQVVFLGHNYNLYNISLGKCGRCACILGDGDMGKGWK